MKKQEYGLSPFEMAMYLVQLSDPDSTEYSVDCYFDIEGARREDIDRAVSELAANHESLRSFYAERNGEPMRVLTNELPTVVWKKADSEENAKKQATAIRRPFVLNKVPVRFTGYELPDQKILLHMDIHHIAFDGRSVMIWSKDLFEILRGNALIQEADLSERSDDLFRLEEGRAFYRELFSDGIPALQMPVKCPRPSVHPGADRELSIAFAPEELSRLGSAAKKCGVTTFAFLLAGISITLGMYTGSEDVTFGFPADMRGQAEKNMSGMFINTAIVRLKPEKRKNLTAYLGEVSRMVKDAARDKWLPMSEVIRELRVARDRSRNPIFDVGVNYLFVPEQHEDGELKVSFSYDLQTLLRDMNITMHRHDGCMDLSIRYASQLFEDALIRRFLQQLQFTLDMMAEKPDGSIDCVCVLPPEQAEKVAEFSDDAGRCIVDRHGCPVPVGVTGRVVRNECASEYVFTGVYGKWGEDGSVVVRNDYSDTDRKDLRQETLPPMMPEKERTMPTGSTLLKTGIKESALRSFCEGKGFTIRTLVGAAYGFTLASYAYAEEAFFHVLFTGENDSLPGHRLQLPMTLPVAMQTDIYKSTEEMLRSVQKQVEPAGDKRHTSGEVCLLGSINECGAESWGSDAENVRRVHDLHGGTMIAFREEDSCPDADGILSSGRAAFVLEISTEDDILVLDGKYRTDAFCRTFIEGFLETFAQVLSECMCREKPEQIMFMYEGAFEPYDRVNQTEVPVDIVSVNRLFERQAALHPDKTAVIAVGESLTFAQLNRLANRAAHGLIALGIDSDDIVGMVLDRTKEIFIAEHAILKAGGAFLPMVPEYPDERIMYCLCDADSPYVITTEAIKVSRPELFADDRPYRTLTIEELIQNDGEENPDLTIDTDSLAYCIYTSGSTGKPKGVMIEHRNMCNYLNANPKHPAIYWHTQDIHAALSVTSISFDMSITERFVSLCNGVTLCMATLDEIHNPRALANLMNANRTESIVCTPSYLMSLLEIPEMREPIARLKAYHVGGEAFPSTLISRLKALNPNSHVINGYGPTETSVSCTSSEVLPGQPVTIGKPEANVKHYVIGRSKQPLPAGMCGELIICGAGVGRGYVKLPEKTSASFFRFKGMPAYHSGDLVRLNAWGEFDYYGRLDNQVKLRGLRIELDEIETVICEYPGAKLAKVIVRNNGTEDYLAAYYTADVVIPVKELRAFLKSRLTPYMVPDAMMQMDEMPLTVNGKIDKKKLPDIRDKMEEREYVAPKDELEEKMCGYFADVLHMQQVGATDNFFEIGGTSLSVALVVSKAMSDGFDMVYKNVFDCPTPRALAEFIRERTEKKAEGMAMHPGQAEDAKEYAADNGNNRSCETQKYSRILGYNNVKHLSGLRTKPLGCVLLTGATGFLGVHVLYELLHRDHVSRIICLVRKKGDSSPDKRLDIIFGYYFDRVLDSKIQEKVRCVDADITDADLVEKLDGEKIDVIINCAAIVKHFETGNQIRKVNYEGVLNLIELALRKKARLVQVSTLSIAGFIQAEKADDTILRETDYDLGQTLGIKYISSKFEAEGAILEAMENRGLCGKIVRIGNLTGRRSDGEFQINVRTNGFMNRLKAYKILGCFPVSQMDMPVEFSPVDMTARAVVLLAGTPDDFSVFHANNCHSIHFANVLEAFERCGYHIEVVEDSIFRERFREALTDEAKGITVSSLISYEGNADESLQWTRWDNSYTVKALYRLGFSWPLISPDYLDNTLQMVDALAFFDEAD